MRRKRILVTMDSSLPSEIAFAQAKALAARLHAKLEVLHVEPWVHRSLGLGVGDPQATSRRALGSLAGLRRLVGAKRTVHTVSGDAAENILRWASFGEFDLLVLGTHARQGVERALLGSVAEAVARRSPIPILVVAHARNRVRSILAPVCLKPHGFAGLAAGADLAEALGARLSVLHVLEPRLGEDEGAGKQTELLRSALDSLPARTVAACRPLIQITRGDPETRILEEAAGHDLLALAGRSPGPVRDWALGGTIERLLRRSPCPVLVAPSPRPAPALRLAGLDLARVPLI